LFWLRQGQRDGRADQLEGVPLGGCGLGEHGDLGASAGEADLVAGQGGQVLEQAAEAAIRLSGRVVLVWGLGQGAGCALCRGDGVPAFWRVLVGLGQLGQAVRRWQVR
jgi:hypothetical protein